MIGRGFLSDYFEGAAAKKLSAVEVSPETSNQHEFNGTLALRRLFGDADRKEIPTRYIWLGGEQEGVTSESYISWYDSRRAHKSRTEYRVYYPDNEVTGLMEEGDTFFLTLCRDGTALVVITPAGSTVQNQLLWLFGIEDQPEFRFEVSEISGSTDAELDFAARFILDELGIEFEEPESRELDNLIDRLGLKFPNTRDFSSLARRSLPQIDPCVDIPDDVLVAWLEREELLFRRLEHHVVSDRLASGFMSDDGADVDGFLSFSLSVQNRRKSRAGQSLENHLEALFSAHRLRHSRGAETESRNRPDFIFPSISEYREASFPPAFLTMLGAKSTLKDRWRQVLQEAQRVEVKHLFTLEPAISENQTEQMQAAKLQLVLPRKLHDSYKVVQKSWLMDLRGFIELVRDRQAAAG